MSAANVDLARLAIGQLNRKERVELLREIVPDRKNPIADEERIVRRAEFAKTFSRSTRWADRVAKDGLLKKVTLPGQSRACGFRLSDVQGLLRGTVKE